VNTSTVTKNARGTDRKERSGLLAIEGSPGLPRKSLRDQKEKESSNCASGDRNGAAFSRRRKLERWEKDLCGKPKQGRRNMPSKKIKYATSTSTKREDVRPGAKKGGYAISGRAQCKKRR